MRAETDSPTLELEADAPGAPLGVPVPSLDHQAPDGEIAPLAAAQESPAAPQADQAGAGRPLKYPVIPGESKAERKARLKRERRARKAGKAPPASSSTPRQDKAPQGPRRAPGVPLPGEAELGELGADLELPEGMTREELDQLAGALGLAFGMGAGLAATRYGEHWELKAEESERLGNAWAPVLAPYLGGMGKAAPWVTAVLVTAGVVAPRVVVTLSSGEPAPRPIAAPAPPASSPAPGDQLEADPPVPEPPRASAAPVGGYKIRKPTK